MRIDNSRWKRLCYCPDAFKERYLLNIEPVRKVTTAFGTRVHELLEEYHKGLMGVSHTAPPCADQAVEDEARVMLEQYKAHYPMQTDQFGEPFDFLDVERFFEVPLPLETCPKCKYWAALELLPYPNGGGSGWYCRGCDFWFNSHTYMGEFDGIVRMRDSKRLKIFETKTERRNTKENSPQAWAVRPQVGLYKWAAEQLYGEPVDAIILNVMTRQSPAGEIGPGFRRDNLERTSEQVEEAIKDLTWWADRAEEWTEQFEGGRWPQCRENCVNGLTGWRCDYHALHIIGRSPETLSEFQPAQEYLAL